VDDTATVPSEPDPDAVDALERGRRQLLTTLLVERFMPYRPTPAEPAPHRSRKGAA
jgi:hypothetical protein